MTDTKTSDDLKFKIKSLTWADGTNPDGTSNLQSSGGHVGMYEINITPPIELFYKKKGDYVYFELGLHSCISAAKDRAFRHHAASLYPYLEISNDG